MVPPDQLNCLCGVTDEPGVIELGGGGEHPPLLIGRIKGRKHVGAVMLLVCNHCGLVFCGMMGNVKAIGRPTPN